MFYQHRHFGVSEYFCKEYGTNFNFPKHIHRSFEFVTVLSGSMRVTVCESTYTLTPGEAVLIFPNQTHSLESTESRHMLIIFSPDIVSAYSAASAEAYPKSNRFAIPQELVSQIAALEDGCSVVKMKGVLYSLCALFDESAEYIKKKNSDTALLSRIFYFVEQAFADNCSLEALSRCVGYSTSYLSRYFKEATGISYNAFVNQYKIEKACYLLANTDKTVLECSLDCGYDSLRSFNRNFKIHIGTTPREYREART